jgi:hypothetical protein
MNVGVDDVTLWPTEHPQLVDALVTGDKVDPLLVKRRPNDEREHGGAVIVDDLLYPSWVLFHCLLFPGSVHSKRSFFTVALWAVAAIE